MSRHAPSTGASTFGTLLDLMTAGADSRALHVAERAGAVAFVTVLTAIAAQVSFPLPFTPVPFTLQPMVVLLGGAVLGARLGMTSQLLYLALGVAGLPVFAFSPLLPPGLARLVGPTGGYLVSYPFAAFLVGALAERGLDRRYASAVLAMAAGLAAVYAFGVAWLAFVVRPPLGFTAAVAAGFAPFVVPDVLKLALAAAVMPGLWWLTGPRAR